MNTHFIKTPEKRHIVEKLNDNYGISDLPYLLIESGKEKIRAFSGSLSKDEIIELGKICKIEIVGCYLMKNENNELRLSFDAPLILKEQISKNVVDINDEQFKLWIRGHDIEFKEEVTKGNVVIRYN